MITEILTKLESQTLELDTKPSGLNCDDGSNVGAFKSHKTFPSYQICIDPDGSTIVIYEATILSQETVTVPSNNLRFHNFQSFEYPLIYNTSEAGFSTKLWMKYEKLIIEGKKDSALLEIYDSLQNELINNRYNVCDDFLQYILGKSKEEIKINFLIHVLNVLSPKKGQLSNWVKFVEFSTEKIKAVYSDSQTNALLKVIR